MPMTGPFAVLPKYLNPVLTPLSGRLPPLALLHHRGRRSGKAYSTPVQAYRAGDGFIVGLAYDRDAAWALNLLTAGGGQMTRAGKRYRLSNPRRTSGPDALGRLPGWASWMMRALDIEDFIEFDATAAEGKS
jgi:deazaflavin-dependent oxidoreductase (nitroreductase family)